MVIIDGKKIAQGIIDGLKKLPKPQKSFAAVFVGSRTASESFLRQKSKIAGELGINFQLFRFPEDISEEELFKKVKEIGADQSIGGMIVQLPLPAKFNQEKVIAAINPGKDVDGLVNNDISPLPVMVVRDILTEATKYEDNTNIRNLKNKIVAVIGRGMLVGKPIAKWLEGRCEAVMIFHSKTNLADLRKANLVITGVGKAGLIKPNMLKEGAGIIDFGFDLIDGKIRGDFDNSKLTNSRTRELGFYTPTPGGTGPILVAELFKNFYTLNKQSE